MINALVVEKENAVNMLWETQAVLMSQITDNMSLYMAKRINSAELSVRVYAVEAELIQVYEMLMFLDPDATRLIGRYYGTLVSRRGQA